MENTRNKKVTWEKISNSPGPRTRSMKEVVASLQQYMATYNNQPGYEDFPDHVLIDDVLYGLGKALSDEFRYADGFAKFKDFLRDHLGPDEGFCPGEDNEKSIYDEHVFKFGASTGRKKGV